MFELEDCCGCFPLKDCIVLMAGFSTIVLFFLLPGIVGFVLQNQYQYMGILEKKLVILAIFPTLILLIRVVFMWYAICFRYDNDGYGIDRPSRKTLSLIYVSTYAVLVIVGILGIIFLWQDYFVHTPLIIFAILMYLGHETHAMMIVKSWEA